MLYVELAAFAGELLSLTVTVGVNDPPVVGVPLITPDELMLRPKGRPLADQVYGAVPPVASNVVDVYAALCLPIGSDVVTMETYEGKAVSKLARVICWVAAPVSSVSPKYILLKLV
jgi:hypothetical protein